MSARRRASSAWIHGRSIVAAQFSNSSSEPAASCGLPGRTAAST
ncbi:hypothetical protein [Amycolatopsis magusensis]